MFLCNLCEVYVSSCDTVLLCCTRLPVCAMWQNEQKIENALLGIVVSMECYRDFGHKHKNVQGPYIVLLLLHSTHKYAQWGMALLTCDYCADLSCYGLMLLYVCALVYELNISYMQPDLSPQSTNSCRAAASLWGQLLSPCVFPSILRIVFHTCMYLYWGCVLMHEFYQVGHLQVTHGKVNLVVYIQSYYSLFWRCKE